MEFAGVQKNHKKGPQEQSELELQLYRRKIISKYALITTSK